MKAFIRWITRCFWDGHDYTSFKWDGPKLWIGHTMKCKHCPAKWPAGVDLPVTKEKP